MREEPPVGYVKVYNPIMLAAALIATAFTGVTTAITYWLYSIDIPDRQIDAVNVWTNFLQVNITFGLWYLTYKYAKISEEPLQKLKRLASNAEQALDWWETLTFIFAPFFNWLKGFKEKMTYQPPSEKPSENKVQVAVAPQQVQPLVHPEVAKYFEGFTRALRSIDGRLRDLEAESHVRNDKEDEEELRWGTEDLK